MASNFWLALIGGAGVVFTASDTWTALTSEEGSFRVQLYPPINTGSQGNQWIAEADLGVVFIVSTYNDLGTQGDYTESVQRLKPFFSSNVPPLDVEHGGGFVPYRTFSLTGITAPDAITLGLIRVNPGGVLDVWDNPYVLTQTDTGVAGYSQELKAYSQELASNVSSVTIFADIDAAQLSIYPNMIVTIDETSALNNGNCESTSTGTCTFYLTLAMPVGEKIVTVSITSGNSQAAYTLTLTRRALPSLTGVALSIGAQQFTFDPLVFEYALEFTYNLNNTALTFTPTVDPVTTDEIYSFLSTGETVRQGSSGDTVQSVIISYEVPLVVQFTVSQLDGTTSATYIFRVKVTASPFLESLETSVGSLAPSFLSAVYNYTLVVGATTSEVIITATVSTAIPHSSLTIGSSDSAGGSTQSLASTQTVDFGYNKIRIVLSGFLDNPRAGPDKYCSPRHPTHSEPSFLEVNAIL